MSDKGFNMSSPVDADAIAVTRVIITKFCLILAGIKLGIFFFESSSVWDLGVSVGPSSAVLGGSIRKGTFLIANCGRRQHFF